MPTLVVVGKGSNLLVADAGFPGWRSRSATAFAGVDIDGTTVRAGGATALPVVARRTAAAGLTGFEWAVGVPGSVGGAVRMNAGGHGSDMAATLVEARVVDLDRRRRGVVAAAGPRPRLPALGARRRSQVVVEADLGAGRGRRGRGRAHAVAEIVRWRRAQPARRPERRLGVHQPRRATRPGGSSTPPVARACGVGTAAVSTKHANFFQADAGGSADDVRRPDGRGPPAGARPRGVALHPETRLVGFAELSIST